ncbi:MAG: M16 family metallopeptidase, partial [Planctomycetota bacterium JB042]
MTSLFLAPLLSILSLLAPELEFHERSLDNGLRVVVHEDASCPIVAVQVWYHVGSKDEDPARQGFAHMFEHMMFRGTDRLGPEDHFEFVRGVGGDCNAYTSFDQTVYVQTVPKNQLPMVLWLEAERMAALKVDEEGFATERAVVEEEARMGMNRPYGTVMEKVLERIFTVHPYRWSPIGKIDHLREATSEELLRFWETYYVPNNATLVVVGDVDHEDVFAQAEEAFGWIPRCADPPRVEVEEPLRDEPLVIEIEERSGPVPIIAAAYRTVPQDHDDAMALEMVMEVLGGGESSRLYRRIVDEEEKAPMAMAGAFALEQTGVAAAGAMTMPFGDVDGVLGLIDEELETLKGEGVTEAELSKVKASFRRSLVDATTTVESKAQQIGTAAVFHGSPGWLNRRAERIEEVTVDDLNRVARTYLVPERRITVEV